MNTAKNYLDALKAKTGATSDYKLAQILGVTRAQISKYRNGYDAFSDEMCLKVAKILEVDPYLMLASSHAERAKNKDEKSAWTALFERLGGMAASIALGIMLNSPIEAQANGNAVYSHNNNASNLYIIRNKVY